MKYPNLAGIKQISIDIETKDQFLTTLGAGSRRGKYGLTDDRIIFQLSTIFFNVESDFTANLNI